MKMAVQQQRRSRIPAMLCIGLAVAAIVIAIGFFTDLTKVSGMFPFLLLALCPLLHMFMHRGHNSRS